MAIWLRRNPGRCGEASREVQELVNHRELETRGEVLSAAGTGLRRHIESCEDCSSAVDEALEVRGMLIGTKSPMEASGDAFTVRVMRAISVLEAERGTPASASPWFALPALAARLAWASALAILLATTWVYQTRTQPSSPAVSAEQVTSLEPPTPATHDEVLASIVGMEP